MRGMLVLRWESGGTLDQPARKADLELFLLTHNQICLSSLSLSSFMLRCFDSDSLVWVSSVSFSRLRMDN